jgi:hypothetical protein
VAVAPLPIALVDRMLRGSSLSAAETILLIGDSIRVEEA